MNAILLAILLPSVGLIGAGLAYVIARAIEGLYFGWQTAQVCEIRSRDLIKWRDVGKVALAAALASVTLVGSFWTSYMGLIGAMAASCIYMLVYVPLLLCCACRKRCCCATARNSLWVGL